MTLFSESSYLCNNGRSKQQPDGRFFFFTPRLRCAAQCTQPHLKSILHFDWGHICKKNNIFEKHGRNCPLTFRALNMELLLLLLCLALILILTPLDCSIFSSSPLPSLALSQLVLKGESPLVVGAYTPARAVCLPAPACDLKAVSPPLSAPLSGAGFIT